LKYKVALVEVIGEIVWDRQRPTEKEKLSGGAFRASFV
jgi:hypothetical protein